MRQEENEGKTAIEQKSNTTGDILLWSALGEIEERLKMAFVYGVDIPEYFQALRVARKAILAQMRLAEYLNEFYAEDYEKHKNDSYSRGVVMDILQICSYEYEEKED